MKTLENIPVTYPYYVFLSASSEPEASDFDDGTYLLGFAEARFLDPYFDRFYEVTGIRIDTTENQIIHGDKYLRSLIDVIILAKKDLQSAPERWPVTLGYELRHFDAEPGAAIIEYATRGGLVEFLAEVLIVVRKACDIGGFVHFNGGE